MWLGVQFARIFFLNHPILDQDHIERDIMKSLVVVAGLAAATLWGQSANRLSAPGLDGIWSATVIVNQPGDPVPHWVLHQRPGRAAGFSMADEKVPSTSGGFEKWCAGAALRSIRHAPGSQTRQWRVGGHIRTRRRANAFHAVPYRAPALRHRNRAEHRGAVGYPGRRARRAKRPGI